jgi:choline dehydrogenase-like flavoprotein
MSKTFIPRALAAGCRLVAGTRVLRLERDGDGWLVRGRGPAGAATVRAGTVFAACGAIQTPALLRRSGITRHVGESLHLHPTVKAVARFREPVNAADMGVPVHQVKEFAPHMSFGGSVSAPPHLALALTDHPGRLDALESEWMHMAVYYAMTRGGVGSVRSVPAFLDPIVRFRLTPGELAELADALKKLCRCLLAAGATTLLPSVRGSAPITSEADLAALPDALPRVQTSLMTVHAFSTCPMGEDRARSATDSFGRVHDVPGLRVADASLLCGPPGVNPQGTIMAITRRNALRFLE